LIKIQDLSFFYTGSKKPVLDNINLHIEDGEFVLISGTSGSGKSTLCRCFNGLVPHFYGGRIAGQIQVQGLDVAGHSVRDMATRVGMVFQDPENQIVSTNVEREIAFGLENLSFPGNLIARRIEEALDTLGIAALRRSEISQLSGGQKQKLAIASVLALHPEVLVLDEPTSELDPQSAEEVLSVVKRLNDDLGITVILVEHRLERVLPFCDRFVVLDGGRIVIDGNVDPVLKNGCQQLINTGIGVPPVVQFACRMPGAFLDGGDIPLTVKSGRALLQKHLRNIQPGQLQSRPANRGEAVISIEKLDFAYPGNKPALRNINLTVYKGEFVAVMGRNASGKSTLIKQLNGLLKPSRGKVKVNGIDISTKTLAELAQRIGLVFQDPNDHLFADTVEEEVGFTLKNKKMPQPEIASRVKKVLEQFGLEEYGLEYPRDLSGGEKQRVALASVIASEPEILVLDEPTRGLEQRLKDELMGFLAEYTRRGHTVILVSHDVETVAEYAGRVILMSEGEIIADGDKHEVLSGALLFSPQINRLVQPFEKQGVPAGILTVDELLQVIR
jgi:energy-coupling factor transport system ATP-binding protein